MFFTHVHETPYFSFSEDQAINTKNTRNSLSKEKLEPWRTAAKQFAEFTHKIQT